MVQMSARERAARRKGAPPQPDEGNVVYVDEEAEQAPGIGHNLPDIDASLSLTPEQWSERMAAVFAGALARKDELIPSFQRFEAGFPLQRGIAGEPPIGIDKWSDEIQGRAGDLKDKLAALKKQADALHSLEKGPVLAAGKSIDGFKNQFIADIENAIRTVNDRRTLYALHKEAEARRVAREEAERAKAGAERLAAEAAKSLEPEDLQAAAEGFSQAAAAQEVAEAKPAELSRVHGQMGSVSSLRSNWTFELTDLMQLVQAVAAGRVPLSYLQVNEVRVRVAIRSENVRDIAGIRVFNDLAVR